MIYLVKTTDREVKLFTSKPTKAKYYYSIDSGEEEEDYQGHFHKVQIPSKEYFGCWEDDYGRYGISLDISNFSDKIISQLEIDKPLEINQCKNMQVLKNNAEQSTPIEIPLKVICPHCKSVLLIEEGDYRKSYEWAYTSYGTRKKCYCYVVDCPCCEEEFKLH